MQHIATSMCIKPLVLWITVLIAISPFQGLGTALSQCGNGDIRLVQQGMNYTCGRLEVCDSGIWSSVCDDAFDFNEAQAACQQLGAGNATGVLGDAIFGEGSGDSIIKISCDSTNASSLYNCTRTVTTDCTHAQDISICCSFECRDDNIRLIDGDILSRGRVETCFNNTWAVVCRDPLTNEEAAEVCSSLGYSRHGAVGINGAYFEAIRVSTTPILAHSNGDCVETGQYQGVVCQANSTLPGGCNHGNMRLVDVVNDPINMTRRGRVEVCVNNAWGDVCSNSFNSPEADVVCNQEPGFTGVGAIVSTGVGTSPIFLDNLRCFGTESSLVTCANEFNPIGVTSCQTDNIAIVQCPDLNECDIGNPCSGKGMLCKNVFMNFTCECAPGLIMTDNGTNCTSTACREGEVRLMLGEGEDTPDYGAFEPNFYTSNDDSLLRAGRVEVCVGGVFGTICEDNQWNNDDASVVCRQLGFSPYGAFPLTSSHSLFLEGSLPALLARVECAGNETDIFSCPTNEVDSISSCSRFQDARVVCQAPSILNTSAECSDGAMRLTGGNSTRGRLEVCINNAWGTVCSHGLGSTEANIVCGSLGGYSGLSVLDNLTEFTGLPDAPVFLSSLNCEGTESSLLQCGSTFGLPPGLYIPSLCDQIVGIECQDIDECSNSSLNNCSQLCNNTEGGFTCSCEQGFEGSTLCVDIDECALSLDNCSRFARCINTVGGYSCTCLPGYQGDGFTCNEMCIVGQTRLLLGDGDQYVTGNLPLRLRNIEEHFTHNNTLLAGRVEYCMSNGIYLTVCGDSWTNMKASIVCRTLGFSPYGAIVVSNGGFRQESPAANILLASCNGAESSLSDCTINEVSGVECSSRDVGVICQPEVNGTLQDKECITGALRLVGGSNELEGRLEICINRAWGTVCSDSFSESDAKVVCRQLGAPFNGTRVHLNAETFGAGTGPIFLDNLACEGEEESLLQCDSYSLSLGIHDCQHSEDVGVTCRDKDECSIDNGGCDQICTNHIGFPYYNCSCHRGYNLGNDNRSCFDMNECEEMGPCHVNATCTNTNGSYICECNDGFHGDGVTCNFTCFDGDVRLVPVEGLVGISPRAVIGRVEVCIDRNFGTVCDDEWTNEDASVACRQLGYSGSGAVPLTRGLFGAPSLANVLIMVECLGTEKKLVHCNHSMQRQGCDRLNDVGVACQNTSIDDSFNTTCNTGEVRIISSASTTQLYIEGRVEVCVNQAWGTFCGDIYFDSMDASVLCGQLGRYSRENSLIVSSSPGTGPIFVDRLECSGDEEMLLDCRFSSPLGVVDQSCDHSMDISIRCVDIDECSSSALNNCSQHCINVLNGFECSCFNGYELLADNFSCEAINACASERHNCHNNATCGYTGPGTFECTCNDGYQGNGTHCENINECDDTSFCHETTQCVDTEGSYCCVCNAGFTPAVQCGNTSLTCEDIDECAERTTHSCDMVNGYCNNTLGSYECLCNHGYNSTSVMNNTCTCEDGQVVLLIDGQLPSIYQSEGRVEVCLNNTYSAVCDDRWDEYEALVVCWQLGFNVSLSSVGGIRQASRVYGTGNASILLDDLSCSGSESSLLNCSRGGQQSHTCDSSEVAGVLCEASCIEGSIRLTVGNDFDYFLDTVVTDEDGIELTYVNDTLREGRVEICVNGKYGAICADENNWSFNEAAVVCRELGFTANGATPVGNGFFTTDSVATLLQSVQCSGNENALSDCTNKSLNVNRCIHQAGVICQDPTTTLGTQCSNGELRLVGDDQNNMGRVEICINNVWGTVCNSLFSASEAEVICRQLGFQYASSRTRGAISTPNIYGPGSGPVFVEFSGSSCEGTEKTLLECDYRPLALTTSACSTHTGDVAVICPLCDEMTNEPCGPNFVCKFQEVFSSICVCAPGYQLEENNCVDINECNSSIVDENCHNCKNMEGSYNCTCDPGFALVIEESRMFCQVIDNCTRNNVTCHENAFCENTGNGSICKCNEGYMEKGSSCVDIDECITREHNCSDFATCENTEGGFNCTCGFKYWGNGFSCNCTEDEIRLMNGSSPSFREGRVEVCRDGVFGTVCDRYWNEFNARVVCNSLGYAGNDHAAVRRSFVTSLYGMASNTTPIHFDEVLCSGSEGTLSACQSAQFVSNCVHSDDAGVRCGVSCIEGDVRLLPEQSSEEFYNKLNITNNYPPYFFINGRLRVGRVEICKDGSFTTVCRDEFWSIQDASVVCSQLGFSAYGAVVGPSRDQFNERKLEVSIVAVECTGNESRLSECISGSQECLTTDDAGVVCQGVEAAVDVGCVHGDLRLINNGVPQLDEGRLEVCVNNVWGTVCGNGFDVLDANVACKMAGFPGGRNHVPKVNVSSGSGPIFFSELACMKDESSLFECNSYDFSSLHSCNHSQDIGVICESACPALNESSPHYGSYSWPTNTPPNSTVTLPCVMTCMGILNNSIAIKSCNRSGLWEETDYTRCPTPRTCDLQTQFQLLDRGDDVSNIISTVTNTIEQSVPEDQSSLNIEMLSTIFSIISSRPALDLTTAQNLANILNDISSWQSDALQKGGAASIINSFETIFDNIQDSMSTVTISSSSIAYRRIMMPLSSLQEHGATFQFNEIEDGFQDRSSPASILLPPPVFSSFTSAGSDIQLSFSAFADANLFPFSPAERFNIGSPVIGATIPPNQNINGNVTINIPLFNTSYRSPSCTFWDTTSNNWSNEGCSLVTYNEANGIVECTCNHLTNFGILANVNPISCEPHQEPNPAFTECLPRTPNVNVSGSNEVLFGQEVALTCQTDDLYRVDWMFEDGTRVEERTSSMGPPVNYSGELYSFRESPSKAVLRTLIFSTSVGEVRSTGIQDILNTGRSHHYKCVASNMGVETNQGVQITITGTDQLPHSYVRFSTAPDDLHLVPELFAGYIGHRMVTEVEEVTAAQCVPLPDGRRIEDVENGWDRYDCILSSNRTDLERVDTGNVLTFPAISINESRVGFCDSEINDTVRHGIYSWRETTVQDNTSLRCFYTDLKAPNSSAQVTRRCMGHRHWAEYFPGDCISETTYEFQRISQIPITAENIEAVVTSLVDVLDTTERDDQISSNANITSNTLERAAMVVLSGNFSTNINFLRNASEVVSGISTWPLTEIRNVSSNIVQSFDLFGENLVGQENFTNDTIYQPRVIFSGLQESLELLRQDGFVFNSSTLINTSNGNTSTFNFTEGFGRISVTLPSEIFEEYDSNGLAFSLYPNTTLFPLDEDRLSQELMIGTPIVGTPIVGAIVANTSVSNLTNPVIIVLPIIVDTQNYTADKLATKCVSWNFTEETWNGEGCTVTCITNESITCECNHLTNFAIIMDIQARLDKTSSKDFTLDIISYIGSVLSIIGLLIALITLIGSPKLRKLDITFAQVQFCISLIGMLLSLLIGTGVENVENEGLCTFFSVLLIYFVLASMLWMAAQGVILFRKLVLIFDIITKRFSIIISLISWGLPLLSVLAALLTLTSGDNWLVFKGGSCFISNIYVLVGTILIPIYIVLIFNFVMFSCSLFVVVRKARQNKRTRLAHYHKVVVGMFGVSIFLGLTWIFGAFIVSEARVVFSYLFVIFNAFQGFVFFLVVVVIRSESRDYWKKTLRLRELTSSIVQKSTMRKKGIDTSMHGNTSAGSVTGNTVVGSKKIDSTSFHNEGFHLQSLDIDTKESEQAVNGCGSPMSELDVKISLESETPIDQ